MKFSTYAAAAVALLTQSTEARMGWGKCDEEPEYMDSVDAVRLAGQWHEQIRDRTNPMIGGANCVTKEFAVNQDGDVDLYYRGKFPMRGYKGVDGTIYCEDGSCDATMAEKEERYPFRIFATDYDNYQIDYFCFTKMGVKMEYFATYTREVVNSEETDALIRAALEEKLPKFAETYDNRFHTYSTYQGENCDYEWMYDDDEHTY